MSTRFIDAHTHVQFPAYDADREAVLSRAREAGVVMVNVGTTRETSRAAVVLAHAASGIYATIGVHPSHASASFHDAQELGSGTDGERIARSGEVFDSAFFGTLASDPSVVAIGECGLDFFRVREGDTETKNRQRELFAVQIQFAAEVRRPLMVHCRAAVPELIAVLREHRRQLNRENAGIAHFFSGTIEEARELLELGFSFTFGGVLTFAREYDAVVRFVPSDRILSETDAPYVAPVPFRGKRNEPAYVVEVVQKLAELKGVSVDEMARRTVDNAERVFGIRLS